MSKHEEILNSLREENDIAATLNNTITSPLGGKSDDMYLVTFNSYIPTDIMFAAYRSTFTVNVTIDSQPPKPYKVGPGAPQTIAVPPGTTKVTADASDIVILDPSMSFICTTF